MFYILSFIYGAAIGSFVEVVVTRLHVAKITKARSKCLSCGEALRASDLIPVLSYILLKGRCRHCKTPFGISALLVEVFYGLMFLCLYIYVLADQASLIFSISWLVYYTLLFISLGVIALYDKAHSYIPIQYLLIYCVLTIIMLFMRYQYDGGGYEVFLGPIVIALPFLIIWIVSRGKALGFGDVILFLGVGAFFGIEQGLAVLLLSIWLGALVGICIYILRKQMGNKNTAIPFVPYIVISFLFVLFTQIDVYSIARVVS